MNSAAPCPRCRCGCGKSGASLLPTITTPPRVRCANWPPSRVPIPRPSPGLRSCRSVAELLNYQLRLFRPEAVQLVGGSGPEDLDLGAFRAGDAVIVVGVAPYSTASLVAA